MANPKSQQYEIIKNGPLCLDKFCADINPFGQGFNKKNSPLLGGAISNVFKKTEDEINHYVSNGNHEAWLGENGNLCIDGKETTYNFTDNQKFYVEELEGIDASYIDYIDDDNYIRVIDSGTRLEVLINGYLSNYPYSASYTYKVLEVYEEKYLAILSPRIENDKINAGFELRTKTGSVVCNSVNVFDTYFHDIPANFNNFIIEVKKLSKADAPYLYMPIICIYALDSNGYLHFSNKIIDDGYYPSIGYFLYFSDSNTWANYTSSGIVYSSGSDTKIVEYHREFGNLISIEVLLEASNYQGLTIGSSDTHNYFYIKNDKETDSGHYVYGILQMNALAEFKNHCVPSACFYKNKYLDEYPFFRLVCTPKGENGTVATYNGFIYCSDSSNYAASYNFYSNDDENTVSALIGSLEDDYVVPRPKFAKRLHLGFINKDTTGDNTTSYEVLIDENNFVQGFSYTRGAYDTHNNTANNLGTLLIPMGTVSNERPFYFVEDSSFYDGKCIVYFDSYTNTWKKIGIKSGIDLYMDDSFILINTTNTYNAIRISDLTQHIWANDWNNRVISTGGFFKGYSHINPSNDAYDQDNYFYFNYIHYGFIDIHSFYKSSSKREIKISSAFNYYKNSEGIPSSQLPEQTVYLHTISSKDSDKCHPEDSFYYNIGNIGYGCDIYNLEIYKNGRYNNSIFSRVVMYFSASSNTGFFIDSNLVNTTYLIDSLYYTPAITMEFKETYSNKNLVYYDKMIYSLRYYGDERKEKLIYPLLTQYFGIDDIFVIQGQRYFTQNNKIYSFSLTADDEIMDSIVFITNIQGLEFKTNTTREAYFWSKNDSSLYIFNADNILRKAYTATEINDIYNAIYYPSLDATIFSTNIGLLCISDRFGMFVIPNDSVDPKDKLYLNTKGYITLFNSNESLIDYYNLWFIDSAWEKLPIKLSTKFYGLGSNLISITDTWYFRLFADKSLYEDMEYPRTGEIKLSVDVLTDRGLSTESKTINIDEKDWDSLTDTVYLRYQPKLQRGVGISINVESPFAIGYLGVGTTPETLQLSKPSLQA